MTSLADLVVPGAEGEDLRVALETCLQTTTADQVEVVSVSRLTGGASRETYAVDAQLDGEPWPLILQRDRGGTRRRDEGMEAEASVVRRAHEAGTPTPIVVLSHGQLPDEQAFTVGNSWFVTEVVAGETIARRILRDDEYAPARDTLASQLGRALAQLHTVPVEGLDWIEEVDQLVAYREVADELELASPAFELAFRWLEQRRPSTADKTLVHGDFRLGNLIVDQQGLAAVIDWELAHVGDPMEDLGWLCVRAWRFGGEGPVAGVGTYADLCDAYAEASGSEVDVDVVRWHEMMGTLKWGIMCASQVEHHRTSVVRSVELAAIGRRIAEQEYDVLRLIGDSPVGAPAPTSSAAGSAVDSAADSAAAGPPRGETTTAELVEAVREFLTDQVMTSVEGPLGFHARVAANVLGIVERELELGPALAKASVTEWEQFGVTSSTELAAMIRSGDLDHRTDELRAALLRLATGKLEITNPRWIVG